MFEAVAAGHTCAHSTRNACTSLGRELQHTSPFSIVSTCQSILILLVTYMRPSELLALRKKDLVPPACATSPVLVDHDRSFRNWSIYQDRNSRWVSPRGQSLVSMGQQALARTEVWIFGRLDLYFDYPASAKLFKTATALGISGMTMYQTRHSGASIDRLRGFRTLHKVQKRGQQRAFSRVTRYAKCSRLTAHYNALPAPTPGQAGNTSATCRGIIDNASASPAAHKRMTGKSLLGVFGGSGFQAKATNHFGLRGHVLDTEIWS